MPPAPLVKQAELEARRLFTLRSSPFGNDEIPAGSGKNTARFLGMRLLHSHQLVENTTKEGQLVPFGNPIGRLNLTFHCRTLEAVCNVPHPGMLPGTVCRMKVQLAHNDPEAVEADLVKWLAAGTTDLW